jgi:hypothetical protein
MAMGPVILITVVGKLPTLISVQMCLGLAHHLPRPYRHLHSVIPRKVRAFLTTDRRLYC